MKNILVIGSLGKMGKEIIKELKGKKEVKVTGMDKGDNFPNEKIDLIIDFSVKEAVFNNLNFALKNNAAYLSGITGFSNEEIESIKTFSNSIPVLLDYNMSIGINVITSILNQLKTKLKDYDIEIIETHHKYKKDSPSGTARKLFNELNKNNEYKNTHGRHGENTRIPEEIGIHAIRGGGVFGEHTVRFLGEHEEVSISHRAFSRLTFVKGAVNAGLWLLNRDKGFYTMRDFLNF